MQLPGSRRHSLRSLSGGQRTLIFLDAPFDRWRAGDESAIGDDAKLGFELFHGKARCAACHPINATNPLGTDYRFHNIGVSAHDKDFEGLAEKALRALDADASEQQLDRLALSTDMSELGRFMVTRNYADVGSFRTPQLRNIGITAPYMHDGSMQTLWDTIDHYNKGGEVNSWLDGGIEALALTEPEIDQLVAFLFTLTDVRFADQNAAAMAKQQQHKAANRPFRDDARASRSTLVFEEGRGVREYAGGYDDWCSQRPRTASRATASPGPPTPAAAPATAPIPQREPAMAGAIAATPAVADTMAQRREMRAARRARKSG